MKLPDDAKELGFSDKTVWRWWKAGKLPHPARQTETGLVDELMPDLVAVVTSFAARLYGQRRGKRKTEKIISEWQNGGDGCES